MESTKITDLGDNPVALDGIINEDPPERIALCHWCHTVILNPTGVNVVHLGGVGEVYACDSYLAGADCRASLPSNVYALS